MLARGLEERFKRPIDRIVVDALNRHQTHRAAAAALGVNHKTFSMWARLLGVRARTVYELPPATPTPRARRSATPT